VDTSIIYATRLAGCNTNSTATNDHMRDFKVIDSELRLMLAIRHMVREEEGRPPSTARIDKLLDERPAELSSAPHQLSVRRRGPLTRLWDIPPLPLRSGTPLLSVYDFQSGRPFP
jgi:hypothetical protein